MQCEPGRYQDQQNQASCKLCEEGRYQDLMGQTTCKPCDMGTFAANVSYSACLGKDEKKYRHRAFSAR